MDQWNGEQRAVAIKMFGFFKTSRFLWITLYMLYFFLEIFFKLYMFRMLLHPSSVPQLQCTAIGFYGFGVFYSIEQVLVMGHFDTLTLID
jgi:hypothetical protein